MASHTSNCSGKDFSVGITKTDLGMTYEKFPNGTIVNIKGYEYEVLQTLSKALNFSFTLVDMSHDPFGSLAENGTWLGSIGAIHREKLDLAISCLTITPERMDVVNFSPAYLVDRIAFFVQPQKLLRNHGTFFLEPFNGRTWLVLFVSLLIYSILLEWLINRKANSNGRGFLFVIGNLVSQEYKIKQWAVFPRRVAVLTLIAFWLMTSSVITTFYECSLTASTSASNPAAINKLKQLLPYFQSGTVEIGVLDGSSYYDYIMTGALSKLGGDTFRNLARPINEDDSYIKLLREGKLVYLVGAKYFITQMHQKGLSDQYHEVEESMCYESLGIAQKKMFPCRKEFGRILQQLEDNKLLLVNMAHMVLSIFLFQWYTKLLKIINILRETGCLDKWEHDLMDDHESSLQRRKLEKLEVVKLIDSDQLDGAFLLWFSGLLISFLVFNLERALELYRNKQGEKKPPPKSGQVVLKNTDLLMDGTVAAWSGASRRRRSKRLTFRKLSKVF